MAVLRDVCDIFHACLAELTSGSTTGIEQFDELHLD